ncbi:type II secretion system F family protein [Candidatus Pelagibacter sp. HIMB1611]|uniref:type II secretion system F family protein n=1 Tax=unclassified Candidatus Pelagibacter TaxID=2647897 RepID=UPI003F850E12
MATFQYAGVQAGKKINGVISASDPKSAAVELRKKKIIVTSIKKGNGKSEKKGSPSLDDVPISNAPIIIAKGNIYLNFGPWAKVPPKELLQFTKKVSTMIKAGLPILESIMMIRDQTVHMKMKMTAHAIIKDLNGGMNLTDAFAKHPKVFDNIYLNMISAGEASGKLDEFLIKLVELLEKNAKIKQGIKSALFYPIMLLTVATVITIFMLWKVVPVFEKMYGSMGVQLPAATLVIVNASRFIANPTNIMKIIGIIIIIRVSYNFMYKNIEGFRHVMHKRFLKFPLFGDLIVKATVSRMCMIMANLTRAGVSIIDTIKISKSVTTNLVFIYALERIGRQIVTGQTLSALLQKEEHIFPPALAQLTAVGERTGNMEEMFQSIANYYEEEFDGVVAALSSIIEPLMIVIIGAIIGVLMIALYMPIFSIGQAVG